jgi:oligoribonuclease (3'-5' exoribonuclease)
MVKPYISLDIETTGLDRISNILQIAMVYDDLETPVKDLPKFNVKIFHNSFRYSEPFALAMNAKLIKEMSVGYDKLGEGWVHNQFAGESILRFMQQFTQDNTEKIVFAGKNVASFDIPMVRGMLDQKDLTIFNKICHYKTIDVGSLYFDVFKENVSLSKINELTGRKEVSHDALDDALDVVYAIRHKLGIKDEQPTE